MIYQPTAVITAGGYATRCEGQMPKALIRAKIITYIEALLIEVIESGINNIIIYCNRPSYLDEIERLASRYCKPIIIVDEGVLSTYILAKRAANICAGNHILFMYGHSPHPSKHLRNIISTPHDTVVSLFKGSSKRIPISWSEYGYIEPPYKISMDLLNNSEHEDWTSFFNSLSSSLKVIPVKAPAEFNNQTERISFERYVNSWFRHWPNNRVNSVTRSVM